MEIAEYAFLTLRGKNRPEHGTPGSCQCGCHYATSGGSSTSTNDSANNASGLTSDPQEPTTTTPAVTEPTRPTEPAQEIPGVCYYTQESTCLHTT